MSKTPEEMAEEDADRIERQAILCVSLLAMNDGEYFAAKKAYKAGYQAARDQLADADKVMNSPEKPDSWISVKDRLPDIYQRVLILIRGRVFISSIEEEYGDEYRDGVITFWDGDWDWPEVTHWMPLPEAPKGEG